MLTGPAQCSASRPPVAERLGVAGLCLAALLGPVALGGTWTWARLGLEATMAAAAVLWACSGPRPRRLVLLPLAMAALLTLQILPLPAGLLGWMSPLSAEAWQATPRGAATGRGTISVDPGVTAVGIRRLLLGLATIAVVADLGRQDWARRWLTAALASSAVVV